ncbi:DUF502 domain-containing protein [Pseudooceanicola nitratireducens]|jgi:uncharacterized membrane protein|uniref:Uncharacterized membrane protein n=1 Tax=Pseudooceanicola nitratireducens TaxID=517719 RepID=A0A1I1LE53_9RHOB|nr:DUF502 domain-containing protein [Pseudooceanicola nitratireducens]MEC7299121.1 DUF502 domain-containing protein [Pseudomonadota bacterium]MBY6157290.1 DUF502 domain-containing protein [Pseudooceanicola nitratireducens]MBY6165889.1 DUF502 domain-containing protein [Pseudooceanicola nitratireducens]SEJ61858.1 Uncharacterized membrane protein [Pseudooceanicola nitratireducens]SFC71374.1 Uncharacterized membrane protein [Pseudooceanicola nitratireducens]
MTDPLSEHMPKPGLLARLRSSFLTGIVVILPIGLTIWLIWTLAGWVDGVVLPLVPQTFQPEKYIGINLRGVGIIFFLVFTIIVGWIAKGLIGRSLLRYAESWVDQLPFVRSIYAGAKQIAETVFNQQDRSFEKACLVQYPRKDIWAIGFVSTEAKGEVATRAQTGSTLMSVFVPTTPNPTSGFLLFFPKEDVIELDMTVEDAAKLVISAGLVYPNAKDPSQPPKLEKVS